MRGQGESFKRDHLIQLAKSIKKPMYCCFSKEQQISIVMFIQSNLIYSSQIFSQLCSSFSFTNICYRYYQLNRSLLTFHYEVMVSSSSYKLILKSHHLVKILIWIHHGIKIFFIMFLNLLLMPMYSLR